MRAVLRRLDGEGYAADVVRPEGIHITGDDFALEALYAVEERRPAAVLLDVRFGDSADERFKGLSILSQIVRKAPRLPVLVFTQYVEGPYRDRAVSASLSVDAPVDFIDKLASPEEVVLRLRRLIGRAPREISIGSDFVLDLDNNVLYATKTDPRQPVREIQGMKFEILRELAVTLYRSEGEVVPFSRLERFSEGEDSRASLRVRIRELKDAMGNAVGRRFSANELIINVRGRGYRLVPPRNLD
jgi:DNA-binding response OmpR family regulator